MKDIITFKREREAKFKDTYERFRHYSIGADTFSPYLSEQLFADGFRPEYPDGKKFAISLSHDMDLLTKYKLFPFHYILKSVYKKLKVKIPKVEEFLYRRVFIEENNPQKLLEVNRKFDVKSTFYFLAIDEKEDGYDYDLAFVSDLIKDIEQSGSEVGLHGGHHAYKDEKKIESEKNRLEKYTADKLRSYRNHYLRFNVPDTWEYLINNDFVTDSTYGFVDIVGFRNGMCHPFKPYDTKKDVFLDILEVPLIIMDTTLFEYMKLTVDDAMLLCKSLIDEVKKNNGAASILWHNHYLSNWGQKFYEELVKYCVDNDGWLPTADELNKWWYKNNYHSQQEEILRSYLTKDSKQ